MTARILVAEDDHFYRFALAGVLREWNYEVVEAQNGLAAWDILQSEDAPKIAILDWMMPGLNGVELCRKVRALVRPEPTYLIVLTSLEGKENAVQALNEGADDFINKPFDRDELRARLKVGERIVGLQTSQTVIFTFARAVEAKSAFTQGHADRVTYYALALASSLQVSAKDLDILRRGAILHDVGKISIPDAVLNKPGKLTPEEYELIKLHPAQGAEIIRPLQTLQDVLPLVRWHHERIDGKGYPDGLKGDEIPPLVRILSVADVYDALRSERPYRPAMPHERCLRIMMQEAEQGGLDIDLARHFMGLPPSVFHLTKAPVGLAELRLSVENITVQDCA